MTKLTNEELLDALIRYTAAMGGKVSVSDKIDEMRFEILQRMAEGAAGEASPLEETWPQHCDLCNQNMESETDRIEWHGLGNCVEICDRCTGSGIELPQVACPVCQGKGKMPTGSAQVPWKLCPNCKATGNIPSGSDSTAGPRPPKCPKCGEHVTLDEAWNPRCDKCDAKWFIVSMELEDFAQFFAAAPAEDAKEKL